MIASASLARAGNLVVVTAVSTLSAPWYFWFVDGAFAARTAAPSFAFYLASGDQARVSVLDSEDPDWTPDVSQRPAARRTLAWTRSIDSDVYSYRVEQRQDGGDWTLIGVVFQDATTWEFRFLTARLDDLSEYEWRITPCDRAGNQGTAIALATETVVRIPDAPAFAIAFDSGTAEVTFSEAS